MPAGWRGAKASDCKTGEQGSSPASGWPIQSGDADDCTQHPGGVVFGAFVCEARADTCISRLVQLIPKNFFFFTFLTLFLRCNRKDFIASF